MSRSKQKSQEKKGKKKIIVSKHHRPGMPTRCWQQCQWSTYTKKQKPINR